MPLKIIAPPAAEPITLEDARAHLRVTPDEDSPPVYFEDAKILRQITQARDWCERFVMRSLAPQTIELALDAFPRGAIQLPMPPVAEIASVKYIDADGAEQTVDAADYVLDDYQEPCWLLPRVLTSWPGTMGVVNSVKVRYIAGYSLATDSPNDRPLPPSIEAAILLVLGHLFENREQTSDLKLEDIPLGVVSLLDPYRIRMSLA